MKKIFVVTELILLLFVSFAYASPDGVVVDGDVRITDGNLVFSDGSVQTTAGQVTLTSICKAISDSGKSLPSFCMSNTNPTITGFAPTSGSVGTQVIIIGTNFSTTSSSNSVKFNGTLASVTSATSTNIVTSIPSGATTGLITVTVGGHTATSSASMTINTPAKYAGTYTGTWVATTGGTDNGTFTMTVDSTGKMSGTIRSSLYGGTMTGSGSVDASGNAQAVFGTTSNGSTFTGSINSTGNLSGTWSKTGTNWSGTFTGNRS